MEVYSVGPDSAWYDGERDFNQDDFVWLVEWYESDSYEGSGEAVALGKDGLLHFTGLGHCSCYGPYDGGFDDKGISPEAFKNNVDNVHGYSSREEVTKKVLELLA